MLTACTVRGSAAMPGDKNSRYSLLVNRRKECRACTGLTNLSQLEGGKFDFEQIGPWSLWLGNLGASLMVVGQEWSGRPGSNWRHSAWEADVLPLNYSRPLESIAYEINSYLL